MAFVYAIFDWLAEGRLHSSLKQRTQWLLYGIVIHTMLASLADTLSIEGDSPWASAPGWPPEQKSVCSASCVMLWVAKNSWLKSQGHAGDYYHELGQMSASLCHHCTLPFSWQVSMRVQSAALSQLHSSCPVLLPLSSEHRIVSFTEEPEATLVGTSFSPLCYLKYLDYCAAVLPSCRSNVPSAVQVLFLFHISSFLSYLSFCFPL